MLIENKPVGYVDEVEELLSVQNHFVKKSFDIIAEEVESYFAQKDSLVDKAIKNINLLKLNSNRLQESFCRLMCPSGELLLVVSRIEKRIGTERSKGTGPDSICLGHGMDCIYDRREGFLYIDDMADTYMLSCATEKAVDLLCHFVLPEWLHLLCSPFGIEKRFLSAAGVSSGQIKSEVYKKISKTIRGMLKNYKHRVINGLKQEIIEQAYNSGAKMHSSVNIA